MGDRVSISFRFGGEESVALFAHWDGLDFVELARDYVVKLNKDVPKAPVDPLQRREPNTVLLDFICQISAYLQQESGRVMSHYYLGADKHSGDNSDNGHHIVDLEDGGLVGE